MAKKTYKFAAVITVADPSKDQTEVCDLAGNRLLGPANGTKDFLPGEPVQMDEAEGDRILALVGPYKAPAAASNIRILK